MAYTKQTWANGSGGGTPTNATRLNYLEQGIADSVSRGELAFSVMDYGAKGDGTTNDQPAIQAALDAAYSAGGGTVLIPGGKTYQLTSRITIRRNTTVSMYGATLQRATPTFAMVRNFDQAADNFPVYTGNSNITILGGTFAGNSSGATTTSGNVLSFAHCENITLRDVTVLDVADAHAVEFNAVKRGRIINCKAFGFKGISGTMSEAFQLDIANTAALCQPQDNTPCADILVDGCESGPSANLPGWARTVGAHNIPTGARTTGVTVVNCFSYNTTDNGIRAYYWTDTLIANNQVFNAGGPGIGAVGCDGVIIANNKVRNGSSHGIAVADSSNAQVYGNGVFGTGAYGIIMSPNAIDFAVRGNYVIGAVSGAYRASSQCNGGAFTGNTARLGGLATFSGAALSITNTCTNVQRWGNDFLGMGASAISDAGVTPNTSTVDRV